MDTLIETRSTAPARHRTARILVVDGEAIVRFGLRRLLAADAAVTVVGEAASARDALFLADRCRPDLVIVDADLGRGSNAATGPDLVRQLFERHRGVRILVLSGSRDRDLMMRTVRLGVHGWVRKGAGTADITRAVHALLRGGTAFDTAAPGRAAAVRDEPPRRGLGGAMLTERESQVLKLLVVGMSNREIGRRLVISEATVKYHVRNLGEKLAVRRRTEIVYTATRHGMV